MNGHFIVSPMDPALLRRLKGCRGVVPLLESLDQVGHAVQAVQAAGTHLHCIWIRTEAPLAAARFDRAWDAVPIALYSPEMGRFRDVVHNVPQWRHMNLRIYLPATSQENLSALRILSSLGIETGLLLEGDALDWDGVADLMTYALFGKGQHAPIAPFNYMADRYRPAARHDLGQCYFDDPGVYLHLDRDGRVALTAGDRDQGHFIASSFDALERLDGNDEYLARMHGWLDSFLQNGGCACCAGWKLCGGRFQEQRRDGNGCGRFFAEWMDALEQYRENRRNPSPEAQTWQP